jgi:ubiquinone/menaquinone biosynthesis C-methylase UbiE
MNWRDSQHDSRRRYLAKFDAAEAERYDAVVGTLAREDEDAYLSDLSGAVRLMPGMEVLDAGAGTGTLTQILVRSPGLRLTALEPAPAMLARLRARPELDGVTAIEGFCDAVADRALFAPARFDVIASRQLVNGLYDPLAAFANWHRWLKPAGAVLVIDGLYERAAWSGTWAEEVDVLPVAACQSTALVPYLLEQSGLQIEAVRMMDAVNRRPSTRTPRYLVVARKRG